MAEFKMAMLALFVAMTSLMATAANAGDPDILTDIIVPPVLDPSTLTRQFFTYTGFRQVRKTNFTGGDTAIIMKATRKEFPALDGQSVSAALLLFPPGSVNPPHIHPRGSELLMVLLGQLEVGLVDSDNKSFVQTLRAPDLFIFPKGLVHFQRNVDDKFPAVAVGMFGSAAAGTVAIGEEVFGSGISEEVLAKSFKVDEQTIDHIVKSFM